MRKIYFKYEFGVFLYAYLHQLDLSLDRSRWCPLDELRDYYKTQTNPEDVANYLLQEAKLNRDKVQYVYSIGEISFYSKVKYLFTRCFFKDVYLTQDEIYYCCQKLLLFSQYLKSNQEIHRLEIELLRVELSKLTYGIIKYKLHRKDKEKAIKVEHFLQNEILKTIKIDEFSKGIKW